MEIKKRKPAHGLFPPLAGPLPSPSRPIPTSPRDAPVISSAKLMGGARIPVTRTAPHSCYQ
jgi:hypothetical protein